MNRLSIAAIAVAGFLIVALTSSALAQKTGGALRLFQYDSPASMSIHEEALNSAQNPVMAVFNNLVLFDQRQPQNRIDGIRPELATQWSWSAEGTALTFRIREGVKWHDSKPFSAVDVKCTWDLILARGSGKLRANPRKSWYRNLDGVTVDGDSVTFHLKRPQPAFIALLASDYSPVYPCHVAPQEMRQHPIGTGPFKFVSYKPNEAIQLIRNDEYWKPGRPYLDGIEWSIVPNRATAVLAFAAGKCDVTFPFGINVPLLKAIKSQAPDAACELAPANQSTNLIVNRDAAPFDNPEIRRAMGSRSTVRALSTFWPRARAISAARCSRRRKASGACRPTCCAPCRATARTSRRTAPKPAS